MENFKKGDTASQKHMSVGVNEILYICALRDRVGINVS